ncbi:MAG TPA: PRC-barrel domain-containing protein [Anaerolineales bacterium]|nr:PRC-barrel domain-containing protein [Anaerolineales bacterium]
MKKLTYFLTLWIALAMVLAACGSAAQGTETPGATGPSVTETGPGGTVTEQATEPMVTETVAPTEPLATATVEATGTVTSTEALPSTGFVDPGRASNLMDFEVYNQENEEVGSVEDMVFNLEEMKIDYLIVDMGGFLGIGGKLVAIPFDQVEVQAATSESAQSQNAIILDVTKDQMEQAPEFNPDMLPDFGQPTDDWDAEIQSFWSGGAGMSSEGTGTPVATETTQPTEVPQATATEAPQSTQSSQPNVAELQGVVLASDLIGIGIQSADGTDIASVQDVIVDPSNGDLQYLAISVSGIEEINGKLVLIPLQAFGLDVQNQVLVLKVDPQVLAGAPTFEEGQLPDTTQADWDADIRSYWQDNLPTESP